MLEYAFFEGDIVPFADAKISVGTHALQYGTGAFAGIRGYLDQDGETINIFRLPEHAARFSTRPSCCAPGCRTTATPSPRPSSTWSRRTRRQRCLRPPVRLQVVRPAHAAPARARRRAHDLHAQARRLPRHRRAGVNAIVSSWARIPDNAIPSRGKLSGAYINSALAKDEAEEKGADEAILLDSRATSPRAAAATSSSCATARLITAPVTGDILEGITRRSFLQFATDLGIPIEQREIDRSELYLADEAFFCGTGVQVAPIASIDGRPVGDGVPGPITAPSRGLLRHRPRPGPELRALPDPGEGKGCVARRLTETPVCCHARRPAPPTCHLFLPESTGK